MARAMPHMLRAIDGEQETIAELEMIAGFDDDLAGETTRVADRLHGLPAQIHPSLERVPETGRNTRPPRPCRGGSALRPRAAGLTDAAASRCYGRRRRGRPSGWLRMSWPPGTSRPSPFRAPRQPL
ncbi:hypothetical protein RLT58_31655 [Streptomyces sp. ITFR-16]|nr:hypothetical protein [Streptomyces sp. ITFR-16]WNI26155.1 hypothetical protein RLT58_31655 [Streptomyces sp. ITFR-16]